VKKFISSLSILLILISSCSSNKQSTDDLNQEIGLTSILYPNEIRDSLAVFTKIKFDFIINEDFFTDSLKNNNKTILRVDIVKLLSQNLSSDEASQTNSYYFNDYFLIEEAKKNKKYDAYVQNLDIGMMKEANCYALSRLEFGDSLALLVWKIEFNSYEACPYYTGTHVLGSLIYDGKIVKTMQLANKETAADAPMSSTSTQFVKITKSGEITFDFETIVEEEDKMIEHTKEKKQFQITKNGFKIISVKK
jgi:hypothetical protein